MSEQKVSGLDPVGLLLARVQMSHRLYTADDGLRDRCLCRIKFCTSLMTSIFLGTVVERALIVEFEKLGGDMSISGKDAQSLYSLYDVATDKLKRPNRKQMSMPLAVQAIIDQTFRLWKRNSSGMPDDAMGYNAEINECCEFLEQVVLPLNERDDIGRLINVLARDAPIGKDRFVKADQRLNNPSLFVAQGSQGVIIWN